MIVIPMAGLSRRFFEAGYDRPKYMLDLKGRPVFDYAVASFAGRVGKEPFVFALKRDFGTEDFVRARLSVLGIDDACLVVLDADTRGQAHTVQLALEGAGAPADAALTIFNIDSFRPGFAMTSEEYGADGYLEVFAGEGTSWSFVEPTPGVPGRAARVVEKQRISDLCCTGLYYFRTRALFEDAYRRERAAPSQPLAEDYVAPLYNHLISDGRTVRYRHIPDEDIKFCGVPAEYEALRSGAEPMGRLQQLFAGAHESRG